MLEVSTQRVYQLCDAGTLAAARNARGGPLPYRKAVEDRLKDIAAGRIAK